MYRPEKIIDSHVHLVTSVTQQARLEAMSQLDERLRRAYYERWQQSLASRNEQGPEEKPSDVMSVAARWEQELDRAGIAKAVFFTSTDTHQEIVRFRALKPERFIGYLSFNPTDPQNAEVLDGHVRADGIRGLKLYPMARFFHVNDPACFPVYEVCQEYHLPVVVHFGLSISALHDLSYGNPLELSAPALRFPGVNWIIPHFGTGLFREALLVAAQYSNVFIDTSSSNNWVRYHDVPLTLEDVFRRTYDALGPKRILFGTDSSFFPRGFRDNILEQQLDIWNTIGLSRPEIDDIFCGNIEALLRM
jgi:predicted TIM-barrel fold metal-dependent hydrolase